MKILILFVLIVGLISCVPMARPYRNVEVRLPELHPYEEAAGRSIWHRAVYFDGDRLIEKRLDEGVISFTARLKAGGLRPIVVYPLDSLSPYGAFWEGSDDTLIVESALGQIADVLLRASEGMPEAVSSLSIESLYENGLEPQLIDQNDLMKKLSEGTLTAKNVKYSKRYEVTPENVPPGYWLSDSVLASSFLVAGLGSMPKLNLFSGAYSFWNREREALLTLVIDEDGRLYTSMKPFMLD